MARFNQVVKIINGRLIKIFYYLNKNIRFLRKQSGLTIPKLAELLGLKKSSLDGIECGQNNTSLEVLDKLHNVFHVSLDDLVYKNLSKGENNI